MPALKELGSREEARPGLRCDAKASELLSGVDFNEDLAHNHTRQNSGYRSRSQHWCQIRSKTDLVLVEWAPDLFMDRVHVRAGISQTQRYAHKFQEPDHDSQSFVFIILNVQFLGRSLATPRARLLQPHLLPLFVFAPNTLATWVSGTGLAWSCQKIWQITKSWSLLSFRSLLKYLTPDYPI